jgi:L-threonylcarbamoyladenylate synthase
MNFDTDIEESLQVLYAGGILLYPTDTVWGIGCDATNAAAVAKIYALKKRSDEKSMIVLLADENEIPKYVTSRAYTSPLLLFMKEVPTLQKT